MERYLFIINNLDKLLVGIYDIGVIQGLIYGMCAIPCDTTLWDCEMYTTLNTVIFPVDTTKERCELCMDVLNKKWPGMCRYERFDVGG